MFKILCINICIFISLEAKTITENYSVEFGVLGEIAKVKATLDIHKNSYVIDVIMNVSSSIAKMATDNLKERHISKGHISKGHYITDSYEMIKSFGEYNTYSHYRTNHNNRTIRLRYKKWKNSKIIRSNIRKLGYYAKNDLVNIFLNLTRYKNQTKGKGYIKKVAGADRRNGSVLLTLPSARKAKEMEELLGPLDQGEWYSTLIMQRKLYASKKGELKIKMAKDAMLKKAVLKDLVFFGDIRIIRQ
jgi:hypothetical protein